MDNPNDNAFNFYAAPAADAPFTPGAHADGQPVGSFYAMSVTKLWIVSVLSFGLYNLLFFYRHWRHLRDHGQQDVSPFWRTVFSPFMYFGLNTQVADAARFKQVPVPSTLGAAAGLYFAANVVGRFVDRIADDGGAWAAVVGLLVIPIATYALTVTQTAMNRVLATEDSRGPVNEGATVGSVIISILGGLLWFVVLLTTLVG